MSDLCDDGLKNQERQAICQVLSRFPAIDTATLYGSRALGRYRAGSDIDLTLLGSIDLPTLNQIEIALDDLLLPYEIDLSVFEQIDNPALREHIERAGKTFYHRKAS